MLAALDTSIVFFLPFGIDALVVYLAARDPEAFWLYPLLVAAGSLAGGAFTFWLGRKAGEAGLERIVSKRRLQRIQTRARRGGALAMVVPAMLPPPFPLTPFVFACGALDVSRWRFFTALGTGRLLRFGTEAVLAQFYGDRVLAVLESDPFRYVMIGFIAIAVIGTAASAVHLWRSTRGERRQPA